MPTSDGKVVCWSQRFGGQDLLCGVWFTSPERRGRSCWTRGNKPHQESLKQSAHIAATPGPSRQPVGLNGCVRQQSVGMRRHRELLPLSCIDRSQRGKGQDDRKEERYYHALAESRTDCRWRLFKGGRGRCWSEMRPRTSCLQHRFGADLALPWRESRRNAVCVDQSVPRRSRTGGGSSPSGSGVPGILPRRDDGIQDPPPINDWTAQVQALAANPAWAQEQFAQWQFLHQQYQHLQYQQQLVAASTTDPWQVLPEDGGSTGDGWSMDTGTDRIGV